MKSQHSLLKRKAVQPRTILKQRLEGNLLFTSLFSLSKSGMHNESPYGAVWKLSADCYDLVPLPIEIQTFKSNYSISS